MAIAPHVHTFPTATNQEILDAVDDTTAISPLGLGQAKSALVQSVLPALIDANSATTAEITDGVVTDKPITPDQLKPVLEQATRIPDKVTAGTKNISAGTRYILTNAYNAAVHATRGAARYRESDVSEVAGYPAASWFLTANGRYFLLAETRVSPKMLGAVADGVTDDTAAINTSRDFCDTAGVPMLIDAYFAYVGPFEIDRPITVIGIGSEVCGIYLVTDNENYGGHITASDCTFSDFEMRCSIPVNIVNGGGHFGCCFTVGDDFTPVTDPEPQPTRNIIFNRVKFGRTGNGSGMAIAVVGRANFVYFNDCYWKGGLTDSHASAILTHWGAWSDGVTTEVEAIPLRQAKFLPGHYSFHPHDIYVRGGRCERTARFLTFSSSYNIFIDGLVFDGTGITGGSLCNITAGDEGQDFAHPDDYGHVYSNIVFQNVLIKHMTGSGSAVSVIDMGGTPVSKQLATDLAGYTDSSYDDDHYGGMVHPRYRQIEYNNVLFDSIHWDAGPLIPPAASAEVNELIVMLRVKGNVTFRNLTSSQTEGNNAWVPAIQITDCHGRFVFDNVKIDSTIELNGANGVIFRDCQFRNPIFPVVEVTLESTTNFFRGQHVVESTTGFEGDIVTVSSGTVIRVQLTNGWTHFTTAETLTNNAAIPISHTVQATAQITVSTSLISTDGTTEVAYLGSNLAKHATSLVLAGAIPFENNVSPFTATGTLTGASSGATATIRAVVDNGATGTLYVGPVTGGPFRAGEAISDGGGGDGNITLSAGGLIYAMQLAYTGETGGGFAINDTVTGATSGATGILVGLTDSGTTGTLYIQRTNATPFQNGENLQVSAVTRGVASGTETARIGLPYQAEDAAFTTGRQIRGSFSDALTSVVLKVQDNGSTGILFVDSVTGTFEHGEWMGDGVAGGGVAQANVLPVARGFSVALNKGDTISYSGGLLYVAQFLPANSAGPVKIEPAPAAATASSGVTLTLERLTENCAFRGCDIRGTNRGAQLVNTRRTVFDGCEIHETGQYGIVLDDTAEADIRNCSFYNNGWRRLITADAATVTRNVQIASACAANVTGNRFANAVYTSRHVEFSVGALGGSVTDNIIVNSAISNDILVTNPLTGGGMITVDRNRNADSTLNGSGTRFGSKTFDPGSIADGDHETTTVTVTGAALGDRATATFSLSLAGVTLTSYVSAANTVTVIFGNLSGSPIDLGSGTLTAYAVRR